MPARLLREGILDSEPVNQLDWPAEVFYRRLMSIVDDFGLYDARPSVLRGRLYPLKLDKVRDADIERWIAECVKARLIRLYTESGKQYILFPKLGSPRNKHPKFPLPSNPHALENSCEQVNTSVPDTGSGSSALNEKNPPTPQRGAGFNPLVVPLPFDSPGFRLAWGDWVEYRRVKAKLSEHAVKKQLTFLAAMPERDAIACLETSIRNDWKGLFPPNSNGKGGRGSTRGDALNDSFAKHAATAFGVKE